MHTPTPPSPPLHALPLSAYWPPATDLDALCRRVADRAAVADIECDAVRDTSRTDGCWYDVRPMLDPREHAEPYIDMAREAIDWALHRGYFQRHPHQPHLLRKVRDPLL